MKNIYKLIIILVLGIFTFQLGANAEIVSGLNNDTFSVRILGIHLNVSSALNIKVSFSNPDAVRLSSASPQFEAGGATQLLGESNPDTNIITLLWDGYIPANEGKITFMLVPGTSMGLSTISIDKVETAYGIDITNNVAIIPDTLTIVNSSGTEVTPLGEFTLLDPGKLTAPGLAAIAFKAENIPSNLTAKLNGEKVNFLENNIGVGVVGLPVDNNELGLTLEVGSGNNKRLVNLGRVKLTKALSTLYPPIIDRAYIYNQTDGSKLKVYGRYFGIGRFGRERVNVEVVPGKPEVSNVNLRRRSTKDNLDSTDCIPEGSYVNISHPAGTTTKKIKVLGQCN